MGLISESVLWPGRFPVGSWPRHITGRSAGAAVGLEVVALDARCLDAKEEEVPGLGDRLCLVTSEQAGCVIYPPDWGMSGVSGSLLIIKLGLEAQMRLTVGLRPSS